MGGFEPEEGLGHHTANRPKRNPVPSLLRTLLSDHLDAGYLEAAEARKNGAAPRARLAEWGWQAIAAIAIAVVFAAAVAQTTRIAPGVMQEQQSLLASIRGEQRDSGALESTRDQLSSEVAGARRSQLEGNEQGKELLNRLDQLGLAAATTEVRGPALIVTLADPGSSGDLSDVSKERIPRSQQVILDRDMQLVVNSLWTSGAEAISVSDVRIGPNVTMRQAGGAILVDNQPTSSPYRIVAIGPANTIKSAFERSPGMARMRLLQKSYGIRLTLATQENVQMAPAASRDVKYAKEIPAGNR
ncbi:hypothetical protein ABG82_12730 [Mycobacteroides immunogenum]|uniref:Uncharacterized protein n=2 Tax=Mycobacteroides immunogenum TaxID=83262 RepID=A0A0N0KLE1_9MYCO|nr:hypothetical protein ABG82_12730 [Mycobacteroides immunogenum]ANO06954.1 hypothetical protein BAB75_12920 [Mycobacteroides immunogenum]KIU39167.1 hypothetical protein TL11_18860 [Mycobacteroides immunogenum]KPG05093.1 hypothetical protein AN909_21440 [Mycobacteroides immunogenum]KPG06851.1 hypothetical protein AN910_22005 [Mycobacteroides immunogenum]